MSVIDPRLASRRRLVAEHGARRRLRSMMLLVAALGLVGLGYWATQSEFLDVDHIVVGDHDHADVAEALAVAGIAEGSTLISAVRSADVIEEVLEADPWVRAASVSVLFPGKIEIEVAEHTASAVVATGDGWALAAADGTLLEATAAPRADLGLVAGAEIVAEGLEFLAAMGTVAPGAVVSSVDGELWAEHDGVRARLGRGTQLRAKAAAFVAMLGEEIPAGWVINLTAPSRPVLYQLPQH